MELPEGMTEDQVVATIDRAIKYLIRNYKFGYYDEEDMLQEGRLFALEALPRYSPDRDCSLEQFLRVHVRNRFINLRRDKMARLEPPCKVCPHVGVDIDTFRYEGGEIVFSCGLYDDPHDCERWMGWHERNTAKRNLVEAYDNEDIRTQQAIAETHDFSEILVRGELCELMDKYMPPQLRADYRRYIEGARLPKTRKQRIEEEIRNIVRDYYGNHFEA